MSITYEYKAILFSWVSSTTLYSFNAVHDPCVDDKAATDDVSGFFSYGYSVRITVLCM